MSMVKGERAIYEKAIDAWGAAAQLDMAVEECAEFIQARCHAGRYDRDLFAADQLRDEVADVTIMMRQMRVLLGEKACDSAISQKLHRLKDLLKSGQPAEPPAKQEKG